MPLLAIAWLLLAAPPEFKPVDEVDGILIESRPVEGSAFAELRMTAVSDASVEALCDAAFGDGSIDPSETEVKLRRVLEQKPDERIIYDQISAPVVSDRDYAVRIVRVREPGGACESRWEAVNDRAPPLQPGWVRIEKLRGSWRFEPDGASTRVIYTIFTDPGGSLPAFLAESSRRNNGLRWVRLVLSRAKGKK